MPKSTAADARRIFTDRSIPRIPRKRSTLSSWRLRGFFSADRSAPQSVSGTGRFLIDAVPFPGRSLDEYRIGVRPHP